MQNLRIIHPSKRWWSDLNLNCWAGAHIMRFWFGAAAQPSQHPVLPAAASTCPTPAVAHWAGLRCDLNMLSAMEMQNKVKISLNVWITRFALKALILQEFVCALCWLWKSTLPLWCHTFHFVLAVLHVWVEGSTCHFPGGELSRFFLQQCLSSTEPYLFCPYISLLLSLLGPFSSWGFPLPLATAAIAIVLHCLPLCCVYLV